MTTDVVARAEALLAGVTPGEWYVGRRHASECEIIGSAQIVCRVPRWDLSGFSDDPGPNAKLIAASPQLVADLVAEIRWLHERNRLLAQTFLDHVGHGGDHFGAEPDDLRWLGTDTPLTRNS